jgi:hypothetical protein
MFSQFFHDELLNMPAPVASAYAREWSCPVFPAADGGWALVQVLADTHQLAAAAEDPRVLVLPTLYDQSPLDSRVIASYAEAGAAAGMSLGTLLSKLSSAEPRFSLQL